MNWKWTTYQYDVVKDGYVIYDLNGEIMKPDDVTALLNKFIGKDSIDYITELENSNESKINDIQKLLNTWIEDE